MYVCQDQSLLYAPKHLRTLFCPLLTLFLHPCFYELSFSLSLSSIPGTARVWRVSRALSSSSTLSCFLLFSFGLNRYVVFAWLRCRCCLNGEGSPWGLLRCRESKQKTVRSRSHLITAAHELEKKKASAPAPEIGIRGGLDEAPHAKSERPNNNKKANALFSHDP